MEIINSKNSFSWEAEVPNIKLLLHANKTIAEIGEHYGYSREHMRTVFKRLRRRGLLPRHEEHEEPMLPTVSNAVIHYPDKKIPSFDFREFLQTAITLQQMQKDKDPSQLDATVKIYTDKPFAISFTSDWHIGNNGTDYETLLKHIDLWLRTPNLYIAALGDITDNFVHPKLKSGLFSGLFSPQDQHDVALAVFTALGTKTLFAQGGNHDGYTWGETGFDLAASFYRNIKSPLLREGGGINITCNDKTTYRIYAKHRYRGFSHLNVTSAVKRMHDGESPFDIGVLGHYHVPTIEHTQKWSGTAQKEVIYMITGSYKIDDKWVREMGFAARGTIGSPTVIFFPHEKKMIPFRYVEDAVMVLENFR